MDPFQTLFANTGGRPLANDDLLVLQNLALAVGLPVLLTDVSPCLVAGCQVYQTGTVWNVGPGVVWTGTQLLPFLSQSNVSLPAMFQAGAVQVVDQRPYQTGGTKPTIKSQAVELVPVVAGAPNLVVDTYGALTYWHRAQEKTRSAKEVQWVATINTIHYDANGVGLPGTPGWGWGLCDGQGGRADLRGRFVAGLDVSRADYDNIGDTGGEEAVTLTTAQLPAHQHHISPVAAGGVNGSGASPHLQGGSQQVTGAGTGSYNTEQTGGSQAHENRPPFYVLAARQWMGY